MKDYLSGIYISSAFEELFLIHRSYFELEKKVLYCGFAKKKSTINIGSGKLEFCQMSFHF